MAQKQSELHAQILEGNRLALSRLITEIENDTEKGQEVLSALFPYTGKAVLIGVTGSPGTGKSSLVNQIAAYYRKETSGKQPKRVAIVAVDPSSPFSGGAVLGDRIRMSSLSGDSGVFIRSMATRGSLGGLSKTTAGVVQAFDAAGYELILIETVGAGQAEVDIARLAHTTLVVEAPGMGDDIQAIKAGILEIADILVINKADRPGVENTERALRNNLQLSSVVKRVEHHGTSLELKSSHTLPDSDWEPPIIKTISTEGMGVADLVAAIEAHQDHILTAGLLREKESLRLEEELYLRMKDELFQNFIQSIDPLELEAMKQNIFTRKLSPYMAVRNLLDGGAK